MQPYCYTREDDLICYSKEYILLELYRAVHPDAPLPDVELAKREIDVARYYKRAVETFCDMPVDVDFNVDPLDFTGFVLHHGAKTLEKAIVACQFDAIKNHPYLQNLENEVSRFGVYGRFIHYSRATDPLYRGIYFVCGYDRDRVLDPKLNVTRIVKNMHTAGVMPLDIIAVRISGKSAFVAHQLVVHHCLNSTTVRALGNMYDLPKRLDQISTWFMRTITMLCRNILDEKLGMTGRMENKIARNNFFPQWGREELRRGGLDADDYTIHTAPEKKSLFDRQMASLNELAAVTFDNEKCKFVVPSRKYIGTNFVCVEQLIYLVGTASNICAVNVEKQYADALFDNLLGCGVLFSRADSKTKSTFLFDGKQIDVIHPIYCRTMKAELYADAKSFSHMVKTHQGAAIRGIHLNDLDQVVDRCKKVGIDLCLEMPQQHFLHAASAADFNSGNFICTVGIPPKSSASFDLLTREMEVLHHFCVNEEPAHGWCVVYGTLESIKEIRAWLRKNHIRYFLAKPTVTQLTGIGAKTGFGPGKNTKSSIMIVVDSICYDAFNYVLLKAKFPEYFHYALEDVQADGEVLSMACASSDLDRMFATCKHYNIPICFDEAHVMDKHYDAKIGMNSRAYRLLYAAYNSPQIHSMMEQIMRIDAGDRMLTPDELRAYNHNPGPILPPTPEQRREQEAYAKKLAEQMAKDSL